MLGRLSQEDCCKFEASLDCIERFRPAQKTECGLILKKEKKKKMVPKKKKMKNHEENIAIKLVIVVREM